MAHIAVVDETVDVDASTLIEGFPGTGLVGKIVADYLIEALDLTHYANVHCEGLPKLASYGTDGPDLASPVRLYSDDDGELLVLQSDVPIDPEAATEFAECFAPWLDEEVLPVFIAGIPTKRDVSSPALYGVGTGDGGDVVEELGLSSPSEQGVISGPTGAFLSHALENDRTALGLLVEADPQFPDPTAAIRVLEGGIEPWTGRDVSVEALEAQASQIQQAKTRLAKEMREAEATSSEAKPLRMFQ